MSRTCSRCPAVVIGAAQVCGRCRDAERLCRDCGKEHHGRPSTLYCAPCRSKRRRKTVLHPFTPEMDQAIRDVYAEHHSTKALAILVRRLERPRWSVQRRAVAIGAASLRTREAPWSAAEIAVLAEFAWMVPARIRLRLKAAGFARTETAVAVMRKRRRLRERADGMTAGALAEMLGVDATTVGRWISIGWLTATKAGGASRDAWHVTDGAARAFVLAHYDAIDLGKIERAGSKVWLLDVLSGGRVGGNVEKLRRAG